MQRIRKKEKEKVLHQERKQKQHETSVSENFENIHCVAKVYTVLPVSTVKCLYSGGREWGREATPTSISIFDFYGIKAFWFEFGNDIFAGFKMPRL